MTAWIHSLTDVQSPHIGDHTTIWQFCVLLKGAVIGSHCNICAHVLIEDDVIVGNRVTIKSGVQLWNGVRLEDSVFIGPNVTFTNDVTPRSKQYPESFASVIVKKGASIGANATLIGPLEVGEFALVGAGSVVTKDIGPYQLWHGVPAVHKGYVTPTGKTFKLSEFEDFRKALKESENG